TFLIFYSFIFLFCFSYIFLFLFFFSSRRRHTRSKRDWSSDVCSSDLHLVEATGATFVESGDGAADRVRTIAADGADLLIDLVGEIGRASCRERVYRSVVGESFKKKMYNTECIRMTL